MMTRNMRFILPLIVCAACSDLSLVRYEIPDGYVGRVVIEYGKPDCLSERSGIPRVEEAASLDAELLAALEDGADVRVCVH